jgi:hypothetical protein
MIGDNLARLPANSPSPPTVEKRTDPRVPGPSYAIAAMMVSELPLRPAPTSRAINISPTGAFVDEIRGAIHP